MKYNIYIALPLPLSLFTFDTHLYFNRNFIFVLNSTLAYFVGGISHFINY